MAEAGRVIRLILREDVRSAGIRDMSICGTDGAFVLFAVRRRHNVYRR